MKTNHLLWYMAGAIYMPLTSVRYERMSEGYERYSVLIFEMQMVRASTVGYSY